MGPDIQISVPYLPNGDLGEALNRMWRESPPGRWVLSIDHDVLILNPHWYWLCQQAIEQRPDGGLFTCWTNRIGARVQRHAQAPMGDDLAEHWRFSQWLYDRHGEHTTDITRQRSAGYFMLSSREIWEEAGGFPDGFYRLDHAYRRRVTKAGYRVYRIDGLYCYHARLTTGDPSPWPIPLPPGRHDQGH